MNRIYVFTLEGCEFCSELKGKLLNEKISFFELDIVQHQTTYEKLLEETGIDLVPSVMVKNPFKHTVRYLVPETNYRTLDECVVLVKEILTQG